MSSIGDNIGVIVAGAIGPFGSGVGVFPKLQRGFVIPGPISDAGPVPPTTLVAQITIEEHHTDELQITDHPVESGAPITDHAFMHPREVRIRCAWSNSPSVTTDYSTFGGIQGNLATALGNAAAGSVQAQLVSAGAKAIGGSAIGNLAVGQLSDVFGQEIVAVGAQFNTGTGRNTTRVQDIYQQLRDIQASRVPIDVYTGKCKYTQMLIKSITVETDVKTENSLAVLLVLKQVIIVYTTVQAINTPSTAQTTPEQTQQTQETGSKAALLVNPDPGTPLATGIQDFIEPYSTPFNDQVEVTTVNAEGFIPD